MEFKHPKYYKELERIRKEFEASLDPEAKASSNKRQATSHKLPGPRPISKCNKGLIHKRQASSIKQQAIDETVPYNDIEEAATNCRSDDMSQEQKRQATSIKRQATSIKRQAFLNNLQCLKIPGALVHEPGLRLQGSGSLYLHKVLAP